MELGNETKKTKVGQSECKISFCEAEISFHLYHSQHY